MKICMIGGGNIGTLLAAEFVQKGYEVYIYSNKPAAWGTTIAVYEQDDTRLFTSTGFTVTSDLSDAVCGAAQIWITLPAFMLDQISAQLLPITQSGQAIIIVPGSGGAEFSFRKLIEKGCILGGLQRVHSIARLKEYGHAVYMLGRKPEVQVAAIPAAQSAALGETISELLDMPCVVLPNFLTLTLTPSNPILHTSRLLTMFGEHATEYVSDHNILFYEEWTNAASQLMIDCDAELQELCSALAPLDMSGVKSLRVHYESNTAQEMTDKIRSIKAFKGLTSPMRETTQGWVPDWQSRYFTADFPFGLKVILDVAHLFGIDVPHMEQLWNWYVEMVRPEKYFVLPDVTREQFISLYCS